LNDDFPGVHRQCCRYLEHPRAFVAGPTLGAFASPASDAVDAALGMRSGSAAGSPRWAPSTCWTEVSP